MGQLVIPVKTEDNCATTIKITILWSISVMTRMPSFPDTPVKMPNVIASNISLDGDESEGSVICRPNDCASEWNKVHISFRFSLHLDNIAPVEALLKHWSFEAPKTLFRTAVPTSVQKKRKHVNLPFPWHLGKIMWCDHKLQKSSFMDLEVRLLCNFCSHRQAWTSTLDWFVASETRNCISM